jgi:hypothetical protein
LKNILFFEKSQNYYIMTVGHIKMFTATPGGIVARVTLTEFSLTLDPDQDFAKVVRYDGTNKLKTNIPKLQFLMILNDIKDIYQIKRDPYDTIYEGPELVVSFTHNGKRYDWRNEGPCGCVKRSPITTPSKRDKLIYDQIIQYLTNQSKELLSHHQCGGGNECISQFSYGEASYSDYYRMITKIISKLQTSFMDYNEGKITVKKLCDELGLIGSALCRGMRTLYLNYRNSTGSNKRPYQKCTSQLHTDKDCIIELCLDHIPKISPDNDLRRKELIYDETFIRLFYELIWTLLKPYGLHTLNLRPMLVYVKQRIDEITGQKDYCVIQCKPQSEHRDPLDNYTCGRAMLMTYDSTKFSKIIIFNTVSEFDDHMDLDTYQKSIENAQ